MPSFNHAPYLPTALDSALAQTFKDFEIVAVDDGSSDESPSILEHYAARHPSIRFFTHPEGRRRGISATFNAAIERARGTHLAWLASDDAWYATTLEEQVAILDRHPGVGLVCGRADVIDGTGRPTGQRIGRDASRDDNLAASVLVSNPIVASTVMIRRETVEKVGAFDEALVYGDWELWVRILAHWDAHFSHRPLAMYRVHGGNTFVGQPSELHLERALAVMNALRQKASAVGGRLAEPRCGALIDLQKSFFLFCLGDLAEARRALVAALAADPSLRATTDGAHQWLKRKQYEPMHPAEASPLSWPYGPWAAEELAAAVGGRYAADIRRRVAALTLARVAGRCYETDPWLALESVVRCVMLDSRWLRERSLAGIFARALGGWMLKRCARRATRPQ